MIVGDALTACLRYKGAYPYWTSDRMGDSILTSFDPVAVDTIALQTLGQFLTDEGDETRSVRLETAATPCLEGAANWAWIPTTRPT